MPTQRESRTSKSASDPKLRGIGKNKLIEPVPGFRPRDGDAVITAAGVGKVSFGGVNNNAWIVLGRDRIPNVNPEHATVADGYGGRGVQGAGAIDIVVGRGSPVPICNFAGSAIELDPVFNIKEVDAISTHKTLSGKDHSGVVMDAARIYLSQTTDIDRAFGLAEGYSNPSPDAFTSPRSAIGLKADEIRIVSRQGIKLVTGPLSTRERMNSQGGGINATYGIDLIAGNGSPGDEKTKQEPLVKGFKLVKAMDQLAILVSECLGLISTLFQVQFGYNIMVGSHWHPEFALLGFPGFPSPVLLFAGLPVLIFESMGKVLTSLVSQKVNIATYRANYLLPTAKEYVCSRYNTTN